MTTIGSALQAPAPVAKAAADPRLVEAARGFESLFTQMLMQSMRATVQKSDLFSGGRGEEIFQGILDQTMSQAASQHGRGLGIARMIVEKFARNAPQPAEAETGRNLDVEGA